MLYFGKTPNEFEFRRKLFLYGLLASVGNAFLIPLGLIAVVDGNTTLALALGLASVLFITTYACARFLSAVTVPGVVLSLILLVLAFFITVSGGNSGTGILYTYGMIAVVIMILGYRLGTLVTLLYAIVVFVVLRSNWLTSYAYTEVFEQRILISTVSTIILIAATEWIRIRSYDLLPNPSTPDIQNTRRDTMTGLLNRTGLEQALPNVDTDDSNSVVAMIDIDRFQAINNRYGRDVGDQVLTAFARVLRNSIKQNDLLCRWGEDAFVAVLHEIDLDSAYRTLEELRVLMAHRVFVFGPHEVTLQFSAGLALMTSQQRFRSALQEAEGNLHQAKQRGRNRIKPMQADMTASGSSAPSKM